MEKIICKICGIESSRYCSLAAHITRTHKLTLKEYYDNYIEPNAEHKCLYCGKDTSFFTLKDGYRKYCSIKCSAIDSNENGDAKKKREETCLKKYGSKSFLGSKFLDRSVNYGGTPESIAKIKATKLARHGNENYNNMEKNKQTKEERYGDPFYSNREQAIETLNLHFNTTGVISPFSINSVRKKIASNIKNMTKPEKKMATFLTNRGFKFKYGEIINGKSFDFTIYNNDKLEMVIEIDGLYAHNLICDGVERTIPDYARFSKVPENVKYIVCDENKVEDCFAEILKYYGVDYENWIKDIIKSLPLEFPYPTYENERMKKDWENLKRLPVIIDRNYVGHSLIRNFHKSIWEARVGNHMTPMEAWNNRKCVDACVRNRVIYSSDLSSQSIVDGFNIAKIAPKVSVFRVGLAKNLVQKYLSDCSTIFDPFSGFSGRMLGTCALDKKYIGQDINFEHVKESNQIIKFLDLNATVIQKDIFESNGEYECLFTCSPYNLKEQWNDNETDLSCDDWIDECLKRFKCKRYLFVVDKTEKYKDNTVERLGNTSHLGNNNEYVILIEK